MRIATALILTVLLVGCSSDESTTIEPLVVGSEEPKVFPLGGDEAPVEKKKFSIKIQIGKKDDHQDQAARTREIIRRQEITNFEYSAINTWVRDHPEVRKMVKPMISKGIITYGQFREIQRFVETDLQAKKDADDRKYWIKRIKERTSKP